MKWIFPGLLLLVLAVCIGTIISDRNKERSGIRPADTPFLDWIPGYPFIKGSGESAEIQDPGKNSKEADSVDMLIAGGIGRITEEHSMEMLLAGDIAIIGIGGYSGAYVEDGTDDEVENVLTLTFENRGSGCSQLMEFVINKKYRFEFTSLFPGETVRVLEENRAEYTSGMEVDSAEIIRKADFSGTPSLLEDRIDISETEGGLKVKNLSGQLLQDGKIYYKYGVSGAFFGGITYMAAVPELKPEEEIVLAPSHYVGGESTIRFVTCDE